MEAFRHQDGYVVVQFYSWFKFYFLLFLGIVMYDNEFETKENKTWTKDKIEPQLTQLQVLELVITNLNYFEGKITVIVAIIIQQPKPTTSNW